MPFSSIHGQIKRDTNCDADFVMNILGTKICFPKRLVLLTILSLGRITADEPFSVDKQAQSDTCDGFGFNFQTSKAFTSSP